MVKVRLSLFETNSSSTHVLVVSPETTIFNKFLSDKAFMVDYCPKWMDEITEKSGSGTFVDIGTLMDFLDKLPPNKRKCFEDAIDTYNKDPEDTESLLEELNSADLWADGKNYGDLHLYGVDLFGDGVERSITVGDTTVKALATSWYDG